MSTVILSLLGLLSVGTVDRTAATATVVDSSTRITSCAVAGSGDSASVSGSMVVATAGDGVELDVSASPGGAPMVSAHAINTKGTGATNKGRMAAPPACTAGGGAAPAASCSVVQGADGVTVTFSVPLSAFGSSEKTFKGHVTLLKRGGDTGGAKVVAQCSSGSPSRASWDLATLKK
jgi:hypothetical protein